jgi:hypothetical protein
MKRSLNAIDATFLELIGNGKVYKILPFKEIIHGQKKIGKIYVMIF